MKKICLIGILSLFAVAGLFSFGKKDTVDTRSQSLDSWLETVDISGRESGKYNILVTAEDLAGNQALNGPFNMFIDPASDLPVARTTNPLNQMRVPGNLNIVGTCIDDDAVEYVEIVLDGSDTPVRAQGREFWSYYLDTNGLAEGTHTISVYGVDVLGVAGKPYTVTWNLDRSRPETAVQNITMGSLVSGKFVLSGSVSDGNGIKRLSYSLDGGATFNPIPLEIKKQKKGETETIPASFKLTIDSAKMADGPSVCWFKAEDGQGSEGIYTFLYFVDNTKPSVKFISPDTAESVNGIFSVSGMAEDTIGIATLSWRSGKDTGTFGLIKGNPYWIKEFDLRGQTAKSFEVEITATDIAGNRTVVTRKIPVDLLSDLPVLTVQSPAVNGVISGEVWLGGFAKDDDGIAEIRYSLDKGAAVTLGSKGELGVGIEAPSAGKHVLELWAVDLNGVRGPSVLVPFTATGSPPEIRIEPVTAVNAEISNEAGVVLSATVASSAGLKSLRYTVTGLPDRTVAVKQGAASAVLKIPVTPDFPFGMVSLGITAVDVHDREIRKKLDFYVTNMGIPRDARPEFSDDTLSASGEVAIAATGKTPAGTGTAKVTIDRVLPEDRPFEHGMTVTLAKDSAVALAIESPVAVTGISWTVSGGLPLKAAAVKTGEGVYRALLPLNPKLPADWAKLEATVTFKDLSTLSVSGVACLVRPIPASGVYDDEQFVWGTTEPDEAGRFRLFDGGTVSGLYNGKPDLSAARVSFEKPVDGLSAELSGNTLTVSGTKDGEYPDVGLVITDTAGNTFTVPPVTFIVDSSAPSLTVDTTERPLYLQGELPVKGAATDDRGIARVEYSFDDGASWTAFSSASFTQKIDIASFGDGLVTFRARAVDLAERTTETVRVFIKDTAAPEVEVLVPAPGDVVNGETSIGFRLADASPVVSAEYRAPGDRTAKDNTVWLPFDLSSLANTLVGTAEKPIAADMEFRFTDAAGNSNMLNSYLFSIDANADLPLVEIHVPAENEVLRKDFVISGVVYDDDQPAKIWYRIDNGALAETGIDNSFLIPVELKSLSDNEHTITLYAEDIHGVRGPEVVRSIRVSLEEPRAEVRSPGFEMTNRDMIDVRGAASDKNGISRVEVSFDNGNSWNLADGAEDWSYRLDSRVIQDGTHVVFVRVYDKYETTGLYSSLINIDNTAPSIRLELPLDGSRSSGVLFISGQTLDNIGLDKVSAKISNIELKQPAVPAALAEIPFENELIISRGLDINALAEGFYNLEVRGFDKAGNITRISRNFEVYRGADRNRIEFLYPLNGEKAQGLFNLYGRVVSEDPVQNLLLYIDEAETSVTELTPAGYFKFTVTPEMIADGMHRINVRALVSGDKIITSEEHTVLYTANGPWITVDNLAMGDFAIDRPWLGGSTGYSFTEEEVVALKAKDTTKEARRILEAKSLAKVEISFDNGKTFVQTESGKKWRYRLETGDLAEGYHFLVVRSTMKNGEIAVTRSIVQIDKTVPQIRLISPGEGGRYNNELVFSGLSSDDVALESVVFSLRSGDKSAYAVPAFIQGLYLDWHFWGATLYDLGFGLTFFDDNVKLQAQFGQFTEEQRALFTTDGMRYGGNVSGVKLLANIASVPMEYFFGPDFSWLSATGAVGANFSYFSETQSGKGQILSAILTQLEFPRITIPKRDVFSTFSLYTELQLWFIPTDVDSSEVNINSIVPHLTGGIRANIF